MDEHLVVKLQLITFCLFFCVCAFDVSEMFIAAFGQSRLVLVLSLKTLSCMCEM